jgi:hypothetical protein
MDLFKKFRDSIQVIGTKKTLGTKKFLQEKKGQEDSKRQEDRKLLLKLRQDIHEGRQVDFPQKFLNEHTTALTEKSRAPGKWVYDPNEKQISSARKKFKRKSKRKSNRKGKFNRKSNRKDKSNRKGKSR